MKNFYLFIVCILLGASIARAQTVASGTTGNCTWTITGTDPNYTLTITGDGSMPNYTIFGYPWYEYRECISNVIIGDGVTSIGEYAFYFSSVLTSVTIPELGTKIGILLLKTVRAWLPLTFPKR